MDRAIGAGTGESWRITPPEHRTFASLPEQSDTTIRRAVPTISSGSPGLSLLSKDDAEDRGLETQSRTVRQGRALCLALSLKPLHVGGEADLPQQLHVFLGR